MKNTLASPISGKQRIEIIDIIRGFALFGVLIANMAFFNSMALLFPKLPPLYETVGNRWHAWGLTLLVHGRFFVIFSFLFGLGFYIFMNRAEAKGFKVSSLFSKRMFGLLIIGFLHLLFIWSGDILFAYSIAGFFLLLFRKKPFKSIVKWIIILLIFAIISMSIMQSINFLAISIIGEEEMVKIFQELHDEMSYTLPNGNYLQILSARFKHEVVTILFFGIPNMVLVVLPLFLMGFYVGKKRYFERINELLPSFKKVCKYSFIIGATLCVPIVLLVIHVHNAPSLLPSLFLSILQYFTGMAIATFYVTSLVLFYKTKKFQVIISYFGYIGKMALTNYLMQLIP